MFAVVVLLLTLAACVPALASTGELEQLVRNELKYLGSESWEVRRNSAEYIASLGPDVVPYLADIARDFTLPDEYSWSESEPGYLDSLPLALAGIARQQPQVLADWLGSSEAGLRLCAAAAFTQGVSPDALPLLEAALLGAMRDPDPRIRALICSGFEDFRARLEDREPYKLDNAMVDALLQLLADGERAELPSHDNGDESVAFWARRALRDRYTDRLKQHREQIVPQLASMLDAPGATARQSALELLPYYVADVARLGLLPRISELAADEDPDVRAKAIQTAASLDPAMAAPLVLSGLFDPQWPVHMYAGFMLDKLPQLKPEDRAILIAALHNSLDKNLGVEDEILNTLGKQWPGDADVMDAAYDVLRRQDWRQQYTAAELLAQQCPDLPGLLSQMAASPEPNLRAGAALIIRKAAQFTPQQLELLTRLLADGDTGVQLVALWTVKEMGEAAAPFKLQLTELLNAQDENVRQAAAAVLAKLPADTKALELLRAAARDPQRDLYDRWYALQTAVNLAPADPATTALLVELYENGGTAMRGGVVRSAGSICDRNPAAVEILVKCADDADPNVRMFAVDGLGDHKITTGQAVAAMMTALQDEDSYVRMAGVLGLGHVGRVTDAVEPLLIMMLGDPDPDVGERAARMLFRLHHVPARPQQSLMGPDGPD